MTWYNLLPKGSIYLQIFRFLILMSLRLSFVVGAMSFRRLMYMLDLNLIRTFE